MARSKRKPRNNVEDRLPPSSAVVLDQELVDVPVDELVLHPQNANQGDLGVVMESMATTGFYGTIIVQKSTMRVCAGNTRLRAARELGITSLPCAVVDCDDETALRILAVDNRSNRLGVDDAELVVEMLQLLAMTDTGLQGTGYDGDDLDAMMADVLGGEKDKPEREPVFKVVVKCNDPQEQAAVLQMCLDQGLDAKAR